MRLDTPFVYGPFVRSGSGKQAAILVAGVVCLAQALRYAGRKKRRRVSPGRAQPDPRLNEESLPDTSIDWERENALLPPLELSGGELLLLDETLPLTPKQLWRLIYDLTFIQHFYQKKGNREIGIGGWQRTDRHVCSKTAHYITPVKKNVLGPSEAYTEEEYLCQRRGINGFLVKVQAYTRKVPYGKSFHVELTWTASRVSAAETRLQVVGAFVPEKRLIGVGNIIRKATNEGLQETYKLYRQHLLGAIGSNRPHSESSSTPLTQADRKAARTSSAITKEAAEDLVRNGVFVSWGQVLCALAVFFCMLFIARLALDQESRKSVAATWMAKLEHASSFLPKECYAA